MIREGTLLPKEPPKQTSFQGTEHWCIRYVIADITDMERHFKRRVLDREDLPIAIGDPIKLEVLKIVTECPSGMLRFDCHHLIQA